MTTCPVCNKPVDPLRARFVAVRGGKVVAYCSPECREAQDTKPTKAPVVELAQPKTPPAGTPKTTLDDLDSAPVIEIVHEPASGVVTSAKDERVTQPTGKFAKEEVEEEKKAEVVEIKESKPRADGSKGSGGADVASAAGEIAERKQRRSRPSAKHLTRERKDSTEAKAGWDWLDEEPADETYARPGTLTESEKPVRWPFVLVFVMAALGGGGFYLWKYVLNKDSRASVVPDPQPMAGTAAAVVDATPPEPDALAITKAYAVEQATRLLRTYVETGTVRVQRMAAAALGRTSDPAAIAALQQAIKAERVDAHRLELAYYLARARGKEGTDTLVQALGEKQRSDRLDAATRLAWLGDNRARTMLVSLLGVAQHKLRAAEELARFKEPAAMKLLEQVRTDPKSSVDEKATATIALFRSGKSDLLGDVKQLLENRSWRTFAAYALAEAKEDAGKPLLVEQVTKGVGKDVRVRAAHSLRKLLGDATDDLLPALVEAMGTAKDIDQIVVAEAILVLAGDLQWAEHP